MISEYLPDLWTVEEVRPGECSAAVSLIGKVDLWSAANTVDSHHESNLKYLALVSHVRPIYIAR